MTNTADATDTAKSRQELLAEIAELRARLAEPEETVSAIRRGEVDAFVMLAPGGEQVYTLDTADLIRQLHLVTDSLPALVAYVDRDLRYRFNSHRYEAWFGMPVHQISGRPMAEVLGEGAFGVLKEAIDATLAGRQISCERWAPLGNNLGERCLRASFVPHVHGTEVLGFVAFVEDVTERKRAEDGLRLLADAGELLSALLGPGEALETGARLAVPRLADWCVIDLLKDRGTNGQRVVSKSPDSERQRQLTQLQCTPPAWHDGSVAADVVRTGAPVLLANGSAAAIPAALAAGPGTAIVAALSPCSLVSLPLVARDRTLGVWHLVYGESLRSHQHEDLTVAIELARRTAVALDNARLYRDLEAANHAKDHFLATLSHELRTPLTPVLAIASKLEADIALPPPLQADLAVIRRNIDLEARLIDDLLDLTRSTRGKLELHSQPTDLRSVLRQACETCGERELAARHLTSDLGAEEHLVWGDPARLAQVFWNLLSNAVKFTPAGGTIRIRTFIAPASALDADAAGIAGADIAPPAPAPSDRERPEHHQQQQQPHLAIEIVDTGIGIEAQALPHIFDAFDQGRSGTARRFGGLGLGLAISRAIVAAHGGSLTAASPGQDRGATFTVLLPLFDAASGGEAAGGGHADAGAAASAAPAWSASSAAATAQPATAVPAIATSDAAPPVTAPAAPQGHILLVEDHADTAEAIDQLLRLLGLQVSVAGTIADAVRAADRGGIDLVISDLGLPDGDGHDLMRRLSGRYALRGIALSGYGRDEDLRRSRAAGFAIHLTKPVTIDTLQAAIKRLGLLT
jgi:PAS domain S-box-containing protein